MNEPEVKTGDQAVEQPKAEPSAQTDAGAQAAEDKAEPSVEPVRADLEKAQAEAARFKDQLLRTAADFDNFRKRSRKDVEDAGRKGLERAMLEFLPVSDNLERAVQAAGQASDVASMLEGVRMVLKLFEDAFGRLGVERVPSVGQPFDPGLHEAVQQIETKEHTPGTVVQELVPGYRLNGKLLRAAMVAVARPPAGDGSSGSASVPPN